MDVDAATQSMIANLPAKTGRSLEEWFVVLDSHPYGRHGEGMTFLKTEHGLSHGFANLIVARHRTRGSAPISGSELVDAQYSGSKKALRPIYERLVASVREFGDDVEVAPKKTGVSLRRSKQFAVIEAASAQRLQFGINLRDTEPTERLRLAGGMCTHRVDVRRLDEVDDELLGWMREAYEIA